MPSANMQKVFSLNLFDELPIAPAEPKIGNVIEFPVKPPHVGQGGRVLEDRWYQNQALEDIDSRLPLGAPRRGGKGQMLVSPTGCGKTSIASRAIKKWLDAGERVLILCDLDRLLKQMNKDLEEEGIFALIEKAGSNALSRFGLPDNTGKIQNCVLASMQTLYEGRLQRWSRDAFDKIVIDECHELKWVGIVAHFTAPYLGLTATPIRADNQSLKEWFHYPYIRTLTMREAIEGWDGVKHEDGHREYVKPFLCRIRLETIPAPQIDLSTIKIVRRDFDQQRDFNQRELDKKIYEHTSWLASAIVQHSGERPSFTYCPKIDSAEAIAKAIRDIGGKAMAYTSKTHDPESVLEMFIAGEIQHLINVNMLIKGVNVPKVSAIFRVRPSINIGTATQEIGRGTRNSPQTGKKDCVIFEFDYQTGGKRLSSVLDSILDGADDPDLIKSDAQKEWDNRIRDRAEKIVRTKEEDDVCRAFDLAKSQLSFEDAEARRKREEERQAKYQRVEVAQTTQVYDPFAGHDKQGIGVSEARGVEHASPEQIARLRELSGGVISEGEARGYSQEAAAKHVTRLEYDRKHNRATEPQKRLMVQVLGMDAKCVSRMKKWDATAAIDARIEQMANDLAAHGFSYEKVLKNSPKELSNLHARFCGSAG